MWKLAGDTPLSKQRNVERLTQSFLSLRGRIPGLLHLEIGVDSSGVDYACELPFVGHDGTQRLPDFTIEDAATGNLYLWEHLGMRSSPKYRASWERKLKGYALSGVLPVADGGGERGSLIITADDAAGGFDSGAVRELIEAVLL